MISWMQVLQHITAWFTEYVWRMLGSAVVLVAGLLLASAIYLYFRRALRNTTRFDIRKRYFAVRGVVILTVLVATATLMLIALGVAGPVIGFVVTLGLALGIFADSLGGFRIFLLRPFEIGDIVELTGEGLTGMVKEITLSGIVLMTPSKAEVILSNRKLFENPIINHSPLGANTLLAFQFVLGLAAGIDVLEQKICSLAAALPGFDSSGGCSVQVTRIESDTVTIVVRFFVSQRRQEDPSTTFLKSAKAEFDRENVSVSSLITLKP